MLFREKPIEAIQYKGFSKNHWQEVYDFCKGDDGISRLTGPHPPDKATIETLEGRFMFVYPGDWIIKDADGGFYPCKQDTFAKKYEPVNKSAGRSYLYDDLVAMAKEKYPELGGHEGMMQVLKDFHIISNPTHAEQ